MRRVWMPPREAIPIARRLKDDDLLVRIAREPGGFAGACGRHVGCACESADATALADRLGDDMSFIAAAQAEAFIAGKDGDFVRMRDVGLAAASRCRQRNELFMLSVHLTSAGMGALMLGENAAAEAALIEALQASLVIDDRPGLVRRLELLASSAAMTGRAERAAELLGASEMLRLRVGAQASPFTRPFVEKAEEQARSVLGETRYNRAFEAGARLDRDGAIRAGNRAEGGPRDGCADRPQRRSTWQT